MPNGPYPDRAKQGRFLAWTDPGKNPVQDPCPCWRAPGTPSDEQAKGFAATDRLRILAGPKKQQWGRIWEHSLRPFGYPPPSGAPPKGPMAPGPRWPWEGGTMAGTPEAAYGANGSDTVSLLSEQNAALTRKRSMCHSTRFRGDNLPLFWAPFCAGIAGSDTRSPPQAQEKRPQAMRLLRPTAYVYGSFGPMYVPGGGEGEKGIRGGDTLFPLRSHNVAGIAGTPGPFPGPRPKGRGLSMVHPRGPCGGLFGLLLRLYHMDPVLPPGPI